MDECVMVQTTLGSSEQAEALAARMVKQRLAACVHRNSIHSIYRWEGAIEQDNEIRLTFKTTLAVKNALIQAIKEAHPYEVPELIVIPITDGDPDYLRWISEMCQPV